MGISGNDKADGLAKLALSSQVISNPPYSASDAIKIIKKLYKTKFIDTCNPCPHSTNISFTYQNKMPPFLTRPRQHQTILSNRLHLQVTNLGNSSTYYH